MITFWISGTPGGAVYWSPVLYYLGKAYYPPNNLPLSQDWSPPGGWSGTLEVRVIIYDSSQNIIAKRDTTVKVKDGGYYVYFWNAGYWKEATVPEPEPPPPSPENYYIWADIQPAGAGQVSGVSWVPESGGLKAGPFPYGTTVKLTAIPAGGYSFKYWEINGEYVGPQTSITLMVTTTLYIRVLFSEIVVPPPAEFRNLVCSYGRLS